jgi:hypothetical protein
MTTQGSCWSAREDLGDSERRSWEREGREREQAMPTLLWLGLRASDDPSRDEEKTNTGEQEELKTRREEEDSTA